MLNLSKSYLPAFAPSVCSVVVVVVAVQSGPQRCMRVVSVAVAVAKMWQGR